MRFRPFFLFILVLAIGWATAGAEAGVIRFAGKKIGQGTAQVASATANGAQAAAGGVADAGKTTGGVVKTGAVAAGKAVAAAPVVAAQGVKAAGKGIWKAIW
ncbi:MAG TPA: hypothetical protein VFD30_08285 [Terriglobia bacterium]|jgi:hypothetical protein|nr:hypothetical protein [Terriglobia bacterium]